MALTRGFIRNAATTPLDARLMDMAKVIADAAGVPRAGLLRSDSAVLAATGTMNVAVGAFEAVLTKGKADGVTIIVNDGTVNVAIAAAPASNSRIDVIYVKHNDDTTGDANALPVLGVLQGAAAASPVEPTGLPTGALRLGTIRVYAGTTATNGGSNVVTNDFAMTAMRGGVVPFRTAAAMNAWTTASVGQRAIDLSSLVVYTWDGGRWMGRVRSRRTKTSAQTIPDATWTLLTWPNVADPDSGFDAISGGVWTVRQPGVYLIYAQVQFAANNAGGQRTIRIRAGAAVGQSSQEIGNATIYGATAQAMLSVYLGAGATIFVEAYQSTNANLATVASDDACYLTIDRIS
jgi:hypothetical protein